MTLTVGTEAIQRASVVGDLGVLLDPELGMRQHIAKVASDCFFQLRRLRQLRQRIWSRRDDAAHPSSGYAHTGLLQFFARWSAFIDSSPTSASTECRSPTDFPAETIRPPYCYSFLQLH
jgi:hypothetical protein